MFGLISMENLNFNKNIFFKKVKFLINIRLLNNYVNNRLEDKNVIVK